MVMVIWWFWRNPQPSGDKWFSCWGGWVSKSGEGGITSHHISTFHQPWLNACIASHHITWLGIGESIWAMTRRLHRITSHHITSDHESTKKELFVEICFETDRKQFKFGQLIFLQCLISEALCSLRFPGAWFLYPTVLDLYLPTVLDLWSLIRFKISRGLIFILYVVLDFIL